MMYRHSLFCLSMATTLLTTVLTLTWPHFCDCWKALLSEQRLVDFHYMRLQNNGITTHYTLENKLHLSVVCVCVCVCVRACVRVCVVSQVNL